MLKIGTKAPEFSLLDENGDLQSFYYFEIILKNFDIL